MLPGEESLGDGLVGSVGKMDAIEAQVTSTRGVGSHGEIKKFPSEFASVGTSHIFVEVVSPAIATGRLQWLRYVYHHMQKTHITSAS